MASGFRRADAGQVGAEIGQTRLMGSSATMVPPHLVHRGNHRIFHGQLAGRIGEIHLIRVCAPRCPKNNFMVVGSICLLDSRVVCAERGG